MKKCFFIIGLVALLGGSVCLTSCKKDEKACKCKFVKDGDTEMALLFPINHDAKSCSDLEKKLAEEMEDVSVSCK
jgi:hypothetical protein